MEMESWPREELERAIRWWTSVSNGEDARIRATPWLKRKLESLTTEARRVLVRRDAMRKPRGSRKDDRKH